ncbi:MAG: TIGR03960 family B12-binding radical SAM protein [Clostridia bacterium]|nr:TIGR03960 family B12-binding radical SAM protein [Clostridia bacterium]
MTDIDRELSKILLKVEKPARYVGGEWNTPDMTKPREADMCFCFPEVYEIGMSNLGVAILYDIINKQPSFVAERCYAPWPDMAAEMRKHSIPLFSLETRKPLKDFTVVGFSVGFELLYTNVLYMFDLAGIPFRAKDRDDSYPIMLAGGPCSVNPAPFADFFDVIVCGEGEEADLDILKIVSEGRKQGLSKREILEKIKTVQGAYVPSLLKDGEKVVKAVVKDFENAPYPTRPLVPNIEAVHDRATVELYRGCASGCRFCQAGFWYRPIRERSAKRCASLAKDMVSSAGFDEISLCSLSTSDYTGLEKLEEELTDFCKAKNVNLSLPSLRISSFKPEMAENAKKNSLTFAPEAGTQRLRDVINKNVSEEEIEKIAVAFEAGYESIKLYFMLGLPTETDEDLDGIVEICKKLKWLYYQKRHKRGLNISVSCAVFIPKPSTPFQWEQQISLEEMHRRQAHLREGLRAVKGVSFSYHGAETSVLEGALARGDEKLSYVIEKAYALGAKFDCWTEHFKWDVWKKAFLECGLKMEDYVKEIPEDKALPWDFIDMGVSKQYMLNQRHLAYKAITTKNCREGCNGCGANKLGRCTI